MLHFPQENAFLPSVSERRLMFFATGPESQQSGSQPEKPKDVPKASTPEEERAAVEKRQLREKTEAASKATDQTKIAMLEWQMENLPGSAKESKAVAKTPNTTLREFDRDSAKGLQNARVDAQINQLEGKLYAMVTPANQRLIEPAIKEYAALRQSIYMNGERAPGGQSLKEVGELQTLKGVPDAKLIEAVISELHALRADQKTMSPKVQANIKRFRDARPLRPAIKNIHPNSLPSPVGEAGPVPTDKPKPLVESGSSPVEKPEHVVVAEKAIGRPMTLPEQVAMKEALALRREAGEGNLFHAINKGAILSRAGFSKQEVNRIMESGAATPPLVDSFQTVDKPKPLV